MKKIFTLFIFFTLLNIQNLYSQCTVNVDTLNISHITCPNGGSVGAAQIIQSNYLNYSWENVTNGQLYNGGGGYGGTFRNDLDAGFYVITASSPYSPSCPDTIYSDTFEIKIPVVSIQSSPTQACADLCNVSMSISLLNAISPNTYSWKVDALQQNSLNYSFTNLCGGLHTYEVFANNQSCGIENFGVSQFAPMILSVNSNDMNCVQLGDATVNITSVGASAVNNYCFSFPQFYDYSTIESVVLNGDNFSINNNTSGVCNLYSDFTSLSADLTPGNNYTLNLDLGTCHINGLTLTDLVKVYVDWNIDGDFDDTGELISQVIPTLSPSNHSLSFNVPSNAIPGQSRMRIVMQNYDLQPNNQANSCDNNSAWFGETEDYSIVVAGSVATPVSYLWSDGQTTQTATNFSSGTYTVTVTDANGCSAIDTAIIINNGSIGVISTGNQTVCNGGIPASLNASSSSTGSYLWTPASDFVNPNIANPIFANGLTSTTIYTCTFSSSGCVVTDTVTVTVNPLPTVTLSVIPNPACVGENILLNAITSIPVNNFRFQHNNGGGWINMTSPAMGNNNPTTYNNIANTTQFRVRVREGTGCGTGPWSPIILVPISVIATQPINHN
ncbi:GEVED domain-containing protein [Flavobacteriales bacterium]|nr:GEVED domain-containing protein [Flavobacteriales bacterium]